ncbi:MAG: DUF2846 domain-containing protein [Agarilytica sp.]
MKKTIALLFAFAMLSGCTTYDFYRVSDDQVIPGLVADKAQVIFLRPSGGVMGGLHAVIFDVTDEKQEIVGVAPAKSKFAMNLTPGKHRLLSTNGLQGHIMELNVLAGKRYFVLVRPIYGNGFQLRPLKPSADDEFGQNNAKFPSWVSETKMAVVADDIHQWHAKFAKNINKVQVRADKVWDEKNDSQRSQLSLSRDDFEKD